MNLSDIKKRQLAEMRRIFGTGNAFTVRDAARALNITIKAASGTLDVLHYHGLVKRWKETVKGKITCIYSFDDMPATPYRAQPQAEPESRKYFAGTVITETENGYTVSEAWRIYGTYKTETRPVASVLGMKQAEKMADRLNARHTKDKLKETRGMVNMPKKRIF